MMYIDRNFTTTYGCLCFNIDSIFFVEEYNRLCLEIIVLPVVLKLHHTREMNDIVFVLLLHKNINK